MKPWRDLSLYWRLLVSYLLVITVASATLYFASEVLAPTFLDWHLDHVRDMAITGHNMFADLEAELSLAHGQAMQEAVLWGVLAATLVAGGVSLLVASRIASPLKEMQHASQRIAAGNYAERLEVTAADEIGELASAFNEMAKTMESTEQRRVELLANVAHELRTPLSSLHGYLEGLEDGYFTPDADTIGACKRQVSRLERLVEDLSLLSRVEAGREPVNLEPAEVGPLLEGAVAGFLPQFKRKSVTLRLSPVSEELRVLADAERTGQVLANLISNALRHTPSGGEVLVSVEPQKSQVLIRITDSGEGIPAEALPYIFTRFYRADKARSREAGGGSGIGLTIARHFVEAQGGRIGASSQEGKGSSFWFTLRRA